MYKRKALQGDRLKSELLGLMEEMIDEIVEKNFEEVNVIAIREQLLQSLLVDIKLEPEEFESLGAVSYTHLDVYKRQGMRRIRHGRGARPGALSRRGVTTPRAC